MALSDATRRGVIRGVGFTLLSIPATASMPRLAAAQEFPTRPVRIIVPAAPGGALDAIARILAQQLSGIWKSQVYVENRPGANWIIGMDATAKSAPDGYTMLVMASSGLTVNPLVFPKMPLDPLRDLATVSPLTESSFVLLANKSLPARTIQDLVAHLRANPRKLNHGSNSSTTMLVSELFKAMAKVEYVDINYRGASQAIAATIAGTTEFCFVDLGTGTSAIDGDTLRPLGVTTAERYALRPDLPSVAEQGLPGYAASTAVLLLSPANMPRDLLGRINASVTEALKAPDVIARLHKMGQVVRTGTAEQVGKDLAAEAALWQKLIKERNLQFGMQ